MEYRIVYFERYSSDELVKVLTEEVNRLMREGWMPQGGISIVKDELGFYNAYQAMIK